MNVYIWKNVRRASEGYHDDGGVVVIASSLDVAREELRREYHYTFRDGRTSTYTRVPADCGAFTEEPDAAYALMDIPDPEAQHVFVFPNAGCC